MTNEQAHREGRDCGDQACRHCSDRAVTLLDQPERLWTPSDWKFLFPYAPPSAYGVVAHNKRPEVLDEEGAEEVG